MDESVRLRPMTAEMYHAYYREYQNDPDLYPDRAQFVPYTYSREKTDRYIQRLAGLNRIGLAVVDRAPEMRVGLVEGQPVFLFRFSVEDIPDTVFVNIMRPAFKCRPCGGTE